MKYNLGTLDLQVLLLLFLFPQGLEAIFQDKGDSEYKACKLIGRPCFDVHLIL